MTKPVDTRKLALLRRIEALETEEAIAALHRELDVLELRQRFPDIELGIQPHRSIAELAAAQGYTGFDYERFKKLAIELAITDEEYRDMLEALKR